jgi:hypothetical protein
MITYAATIIATATVTISSLTALTMMRTSYVITRLRKDYIRSKLVVFRSHSSVIQQWLLRVIISHIVIMG